MSWTFPNILSLSRLALTPLFVIALLQGRPARALVIFLIAGVTDLLDGLAARYLKQESALGAILDPVADKLLLTTAFVMLTIPGRHPGILIPVWVTVLVIARDVLILVVSLAIFLSLDVSKFPPVALSKWNTAVQIITVIVVLASGFFSGLSVPTYVCIYLVAALTVMSGLYYAYLTSKMIEENTE